MNKVTLTGELGELAYNHELYGKHYYKGTVAVPRDSGTVDYIPLIFSEHLKESKGHICITGQIRSFNENGKTKLFVAVKDVLGPVGEGNNLFLDGFVCKPVVYRTTPLGREIAEVLLAVNFEGKSAYIPCILWGRNARMAANFEIGTHVMFWGRLQSRPYIKKISETDIEKRITYEVSVSDFRRYE